MVMIKEKVIRILKRELDISKNLNGTFDDFIKECNNPNPTYTIEEVHQALSMAIKAVEQEPRWIAMVKREPTDEEKAEYLAQNGEELCYMLENEMPFNGQEVLVSVGKYVSEDVFVEDFYNFENNDIENVDAWMPLPKAYSEVEK